MDALIISAGQDTGGQNIRWKWAADRHMAGRLRIRAVTASLTYAKYPTDVLSHGNGGAVRRLWVDADVVHLNNRPNIYDRHARVRPKPVLLHHHGTVFRTSPDDPMAIAAAKRWIQAVSTLDLAEIAPDVLHWLPTAYNLDELAGIRRRLQRPSDGIVRVATAPTFRDGKGTDYLIASIERLQRDGLPVALDLIEGVTNAEAIARKATADIYFDQIATVRERDGKRIQYPGGYGCNAVEAWGLGMPVIAGATPATTARMRREFNGRLPFAAATVRTLTSVLRRLVESADARAEWAVRGMEHAARFHAEAPAVERLFDLYQRALGSYRTRTVAA